MQVTIEDGNIKDFKDTNAKKLTQGKSNIGSKRAATISCEVDHREWVQSVCFGVDASTRTHVCTH